MQGGTRTTRLKGVRRKRIADQLQILFVRGRRRCRVDELRLYCRVLRLYCSKRAAHRTEHETLTKVRPPWPRWRLGAEWLGSWTTAPNRVSSRHACARAIAAI